MNAHKIMVNGLARKLGIRPNTLSMRLTSGRDMTVGSMAETLKAMDYRLVAVPREAALPEGSFEAE